MRGMTQALRAGDAAQLEAAATQLQQGLMQATSHFQTLRSHRGRHAPQTRVRLETAVAELASQREALARAAAANERAAQVLMPTPAQAYGEQGQGLREASRGEMTA